MTKPECQAVMEQIYAYLDGELDRASQERLKHHLLECPPCVDEYERDLLLKSLLQRSCACEEAPTALRAQIMTRISITVTSVQVERD
ncbi:mycothiol system anti-sigma-R factor [Luteipulveratus sp. YIM 133132]|uniref:Mycothiol system anti-sigma-R factor n=1 Tax=Luteipulveratus flavus TaxID=3031728 RepID=A0ABT6CCS4_9MICO|nr:MULTISPECIES: mycothiol system anti-sigma-R factor [unclassified Luteipulveratus]MDE9365884.1 mycothiol system anti-sigma-R factor [Luteipulveratus sp. YIM 133132]MDF8265076.1 mycothiol system anti-sigma-R factor [Luteipulveratus sp. YIM 133296]